MNTILTNKRLNSKTSNINAMEVTSIPLFGHLRLKVSKGGEQYDEEYIFTDAPLTKLEDAKFKAFGCDFTVSCKPNKKHVDVTWTVTYDGESDVVKQRLYPERNLDEWEVEQGFHLLQSALQLDCMRKSFF